jgi:hypothetical protein
VDPTSDPRVALQRLQAAVASGALADVVDRHGLRLVVVHGSAVDPAAHPGDLDLAVDHDGAMDVLVLLEDLYRVTGCERIDVVDLRRAGIVARGESLGHGRLLWERDEGAFAEQQVVALATMWDTRWLRDVELDLLRERPVSGP